MSGRYQVITYDSDSGTDEKFEYRDLAAAERAARAYVEDFEETAYEGAIVCDLKERKILKVLGYFPEDSRPSFELNSICDRCTLLGRECAGTSNQVWTGCVYRKTREEARA